MQQAVFLLLPKLPPSFILIALCGSVVLLIEHMGTLRLMDRFFYLPIVYVCFYFQTMNPDRISRRK